MKCFADETFIVLKKKMKSDLEIFSCKEIVVSHVRLLQILLISDGKQNNQEL